MLYSPGLESRNWVTHPAAKVSPSTAWISHPAGVLCPTAEISHPTAKSRALQLRSCALQTMPRTPHRASPLAA